MVKLLQNTEARTGNSVVFVIIGKGSHLFNSKKVTVTNKQSSTAYTCNSFEKTPLIQLSLIVIPHLIQNVTLQTVVLIIIFMPNCTSSGKEKENIVLPGMVSHL